MVNQSRKRVGLALRDFNRISALCTTLLVTILVAPSTAAPQSFEVVSIKLAAVAKGDPRIAGASQIHVQPGGRVSITNATLQDLIMRAYDLPGFLIDGGPKWIDRDRFDFLAKTENGAIGSMPAIRRLVQAALADSFQLHTHIAVRQMAVLELVRARKDGSLGPKITPFAMTCAAFREARGWAPLSTDDPDSPCQTRLTQTAPTNALTTWTGVSMKSFAKFLTLTLRSRPVVDRTGLGGLFNVEFEESMSQQADLSSDSKYMSTETALREQLGLKLVSARGAIDILVIDSATLPNRD